MAPGTAAHQIFACHQETCCGLPPAEFRRLVRRFDVDSLRTGRPKVLSAEGVTKYSRREDERDLW
jgi:hypothetical protein